MAAATGLDLLVESGFVSLAGTRVGLLAHAGSVDRDLRHAAILLAGAPGVSMVRLFAAEHGLFGAAQDMEPVAEATEPFTGLPIVSLYGTSACTLAPPAGSLDDLDALVVDLPDVGSRYYTYLATLAL